jgi:glycosyltransferase involved in cell wall biosynthesis
LLEAVAVVAETEDLKLILAGSRDNKSYVARLESQAKQLGILDRVQFRGVLDEAALLDEFSSASVLVLPSYQETAPMVIQEAMAAGVPVIASRVGGIPYQVEDGKSGIIVDSGDVGALTKSLRAVLTDQALRQTFSDSAKQRAETQYRAQVIADQTTDLYRQIAAS